jgi:carbonic anhydrase/acetyltransferase-like protein (isoleucine patch superfamily)
LILPHHGKWPLIHETAFIAPSADIVGEVQIGTESSVWFQCVVRGDVNSIRIGSRTNIQDHSMLHVTRRTHPLTVGDEVTVGHRVTLHGCKVGNRCLIGMGAIIMDGAEIGDDCLIGAGALVTKGKSIPARSLVLGSPAEVVRVVSAEELAYFKKSAENYVQDSLEYRRFLRGPEKLGSSSKDLEDLDSLRKLDDDDGDLE